MALFRTGSARRVPLMMSPMLFADSINIVTRIRAGPVSAMLYILDPTATSTSSLQLSPPSTRPLREHEGTDGDDDPSSNHAASVG